MQQHDDIDTNIRREIKRSKTITWIYIIVDVVATILIFGSFCILCHQKLNLVQSMDDNAYVILEFLAPIFDVLIALILVSSALYLTRSLRSSTGRKPNFCLLSWHIVNLFILITMLVSAGLCYENFVDAPPEDFVKYFY